MFNSNWKQKFKSTFENFGDNKDFFFVQIGSNDGIRADPLYEWICKYNWSGIMVEPVPYLYERLVKNHASRKNLIFKNVAVCETNGIMKFYYIKDNGNHTQTSWTCGNGLGSFIKEQVLKSRSHIKDFDKKFTEMDVETVTFDKLVEGVERIDLICVDAEGYDIKILKSIDFDRYNPSLVYFENLVFTKEEKKDIWSYLNSHGYECVSNNHNTLAITKNK